MINTSYLNPIAPLPRRHEAGQRIESQFDKDRDADGRYAGGERRRGGGSSGAADPSRAERPPSAPRAADVVDLSPDAAREACSVFVTRLAANFLGGLAAAPSDAPRPIPLAQRALAERYQRQIGSSAVGRDEVPPGMTTVEEAGVRIAQAIVSHYPETAFGAEDSAARRLRYTEAMLARFEREAAESALEAAVAAPAASDALSRLRRLLRAHLERFCAQAA